MQTIIETIRFIKAAKDLLSQEELDNLKDILSRNPDAGELIKGTGGFRKIRLARKDSGKSGGYRVITFFYNYEIPVFLVDIYAKSKQDNLSKSQQNALYNIADQFIEYGE